jgi:hypothetical protein
MGNKLFNGLSSFDIFGLKRKIDIMKKRSKHIKLVLHRSNHQLTDVALLFHLVTYIQNKNVKIRLDKTQNVTKTYLI